MLRSMLRVFVYVTAGNTIGAAIFITIFGREVRFNYLLLWQIVAIAAACALGNLIFWVRENCNKYDKIRMTIHYFYNMAVVMGGALLFDWISFKRISTVIFLFLSFNAVYFFITATLYQRDERIAEEVNNRLRRMNKEDV